MRQADMATASVVYRKTAGTGVPEVNTLATLKTDLGLTGTNSGDQTSIVGITGTVAQFNTAITDGDLATGGGTATGTNTGDQTITLTTDVTGSGSGSFAATIANDAVTNAKLANMATATFKGRNTAGTGDPEDLSTATAKTMLDLTGTNSGDQTITLTGNVTGSGTGSFATTIAASAVTLAMQADVATATVFYRKTAAAGAPEVQTLATLKTDLGLTGTNSGDQSSIVGITGTVAQFNTAITDGDLATGGGTATGTNTGDQTITLTGPVTGSGTGSFATTITNKAVTLAKMDDVATATVFYRKTAATGVPEVQTLATLKTDLGLTGTNSGDQTSIVGITGTIAQFNTAITDGDLATGGGTATGANTGDQTITLTGDVTGSGTGSFAATIAADAVTYAKLQNAAAGNVALTRANAAAGDYGETALAASQLLGRGSTGDIAAIVLGSGLSMAGTTLSSSGGGGTTLTTVEKDLGSAKRSGSFTIAGAGMTIGKPVLISKAVGPYTNKGTLADEAEMDIISANASVTSATVITAYWTASGPITGNVKFDYFIGG